MAEYLTATTLERKIQEFVGVLVQQPTVEIDNSFNIKPIRERRVEYFNIMIAEAYYLFHYSNRAD